MTSKTCIGIGRTPSGQYVWWLTTASGLRLYNSEPFASKQECERAIRAMKRELIAAPIMDITAHTPSAPRPLRLVA